MRPDYGFAFTGLCELLQGNEGEESQGGTGARLQVPTGLVPWILLSVVDHGAVTLVARVADPVHFRPHPDPANHNF